MTDIGSLFLNIIGIGETTSKIFSGVSLRETASLGNVASARSDSEN